jgi:hypothetical protein
MAVAQSVLFTFGLKTTESVCFLCYLLCIVPVFNNVPLVGCSNITVDLINPISSYCDDLNNVIVIQ